ncbi:hypothetical protein P154DRAFT_84200 [Amniculicola lignicola CBS 123094]|uniref:Uncharacterized protein n=1 Tax=Amniculicola lignicola CBS 123094 TaxID=1392246 RepID=A0A6A5WNW1_9PLEO|nr:hypothetical protein P154DRAFT_84200 [Amniculicola lignicola CBS 123094]
MGNTQSHGLHGHPNRLSKPKTNSNSPFTGSPASLSSKYADFNVTERELFKSQLTSPIDTDFGSRPSADDELGDLATRVQERLSNLSRSNSVASRLASARNSTAQLPNGSGSRLSLPPSNQPVDLGTAIRILQEIRRNASPDDLAALHEALQPSAPTILPASSPSLPPQPERRTSIINRSSLSLSKRRSLAAVPGLATRSAPSNSMRKSWSSWRTPRLHEAQEHKWKELDMIGTSPLTRLAAWEDGRDSPAPRAVTPGDMAYSHLGSFKLGSLVIANGAPSPAPSSRRMRRRSISSLAQEDDYFTASEGRSSPSPWRASQSARNNGRPSRSTANRFLGGKKRHGRSKSTILPQTTALHGEGRVVDRMSKISSRCDSPLKIETHDHEPLRRLQVVNHSAASLAKDYRAEIPHSPFVASPPKEYQDEGFADTSSDGMSIREETLRIFNGTIFDEPATTEKQYKKTQRPPPAKADSGYSSGGSLRTVHRDVQNRVRPTSFKRTSVIADSLKSGNGSATDDSASLYTFEQMLALPLSKKPLPPIPTDEDTNAAQEPAGYLSNGPDPSHFSQSTLEVARQTFLHVPESSASHNLSPTSPKSVSSYWTLDSKASASNQKRLQKRRPSQPELPLVQACAVVPDGSIPSIPHDIRSTFIRRLSASPAMECLTHTYQSTDHVESPESVDDSSPVAPIQFPSPSPTPVPRRSRSRSRADTPPTPPPHGGRRSLSLFRRKSTAEKQQDGGYRTLDVVDLGTVASALGRSPYDAAMPVATNTMKPVTSPTHPHQLGAALPRAKSMVNLDAAEAAELARMRSRDLHPDISQRPRSYHHLKPEGMDDPRPQKRHSFYDSAPPVPLTDTSHSPFDRAASAPVDDDSASNYTPSVRIKSTGRGQVVSQLVTKFDTYGQPSDQAEPQDWEPHARLWNQRRKSIGEGLRQRAEAPKQSSLMNKREASPASEEMIAYGRYSGGLQYGYEHGYGVGGSAGTRQLHSYASRKSMHISNQFGVDLSDIPVFVTRA